MSDGIEWYVLLFTTIWRQKLVKMLSTHEAKPWLRPWYSPQFFHFFPLTWYVLLKVATRPAIWPMIARSCWRSAKCSWQPVCLRYWPRKEKDVDHELSKVLQKAAFISAKKCLSFFTEWQMQNHRWSSTGFRSYSFNTLIMLY